jgi:hypothetical protein
MQFTERDAAVDQRLGRADANSGFDALPARARN